jgi:hypothetical protein
MEPAPAPLPLGPPPHVHRFMKRKLRQGCCCLTFLILVNLLVVMYVAKKVTKISNLFSPDSEVMFMPGGFKPFCSELCVSLCVEDNNNNDMNMNNEPPQDVSTDANIFSCELKSCLSSCAQYFENKNQHSNDMYVDPRQDQREPHRGDSSSDENRDGSHESRDHSHDGSQEHRNGPHDGNDHHDGNNDNKHQPHRPIFF